MTLMSMSGDTEKEMLTMKNEHMNGKRQDEKWGL